MFKGFKMIDKVKRKNVNYGWERNYDPDNDPHSDAGIYKAVKVLHDGGIETYSRCSAKTSGPLAVHLCAYSLRIVLDDLHTMLLCQLKHLLHWARITIQVNRHYEFRLARLESIFNLVQVDEVRFWATIYQNRHSPGVDNCIG